MFSFKKRRLRVDILTIFISLLLFTSLAIIFYSYARNTTAILKIADDLITRSNQAISTELDAYLRPAVFIKMGTHLLSDKRLGDSDMQALTTFMDVALEAHPQFSSISLADRDGNIFIESHLTGNNQEDSSIPFFSMLHIPSQAKFVSEIITRTNNRASLSLAYENQNDAVINTEQNIPINYDPRTRPWFIGAKNLQQNYWLGIYQLYNSTKPIVSAAFPIRIRNNTEGVISVNLNIETLVNFLHSFELNKNNVVFIVNNKQQIIADNTWRMTKSTIKPPETETKDPRINIAYTYHLQTKKNNFIFAANGTRYIAAFRPYAFNATETWEIATLAPLDHFIGGIKLTHYYTLAMSLFMLGIGLTLVIISAHRISRPIMFLAEETKNLIRLQPNNPIELKSDIYEIQIMRDAVNSTKSTLSSFAKYVPKTLVEQLMQSGNIAQLGGEKKDITILFTDIANFTEIAEKIAPEALMLHISDYLNTLTNIIHFYKGNIDKYIGDAIMAFWGAPLADNDQVYHACFAALTCSFEVQRMNKLWLAEGKPALPTRFGLNYGDAIVGNMGSVDRLNYTAIGDNVNLAARLEAINKTYGTAIIASQSIYEQCKEQFLFRPLDVVHVRGKRLSTPIYELMATKTGNNNLLATPQQIGLAELSGVAYNSYLQGDITKAAALFADILNKYPEDGMAKLYIQRCKEIS